MNPGNSGGVLVNSQGNVMGIPMLTVVDPEFHTPAMALVSPSWSITSGQRYEMNRLCYHLERRISMKGLFYHRSATEEQVPQPMKEGVGATDPGPRNIALDRQNPDLLTPPLSDAELTHVRGGESVPVRSYVAGPYNSFRSRAEIP
ncbi:MAG TPA: hypothetical protein VGN34_33285 [Ktedonobacteraceae bacterium]